MKNHFKIKTYAIGSLIMIALIAVLFTVFMPTQRPPSLEFAGENAFISSKKFLTFTDEDLILHGEKDSYYQIEAGVRSFFSERDISVAEILQNIKPEKNLKVIFAKYDPKIEKFKIFPSGAYKNTVALSENELSTEIVPALNGFFIIASRDFQVSEIKPMTEQASGSINVNTLSPGWNLVSIKNIEETVRSCSNRISDMWLSELKYYQKSFLNEIDKTLTRQISEDEILTSEEYFQRDNQKANDLGFMNWIYLVGNKETCAMEDFTTSVYPVFVENIYGESLTGGTGIALSFFYPEELRNDITEFKIAFDKVSHFNGNYSVFRDYPFYSVFSDLDRLTTSTIFSSIENQVYQEKVILPESFKGEKFVFVSVFPTNKNGYISPYGKEITIKLEEDTNTSDVNNKPAGQIYDNSTRPINPDNGLKIKTETDQKVILINPEYSSQKVSDEKTNALIQQKDSVDSGKTKIQNNNDTGTLSDLVQNSCKENYEIIDNNTLCVLKNGSSDEFKTFVCSGSSGLSGTFYGLNNYCDFSYNWLQCNSDTIGETDTLKKYICDRHNGGFAWKGCVESFDGKIISDYVCEGGVWQKCDTENEIIGEYICNSGSFVKCEEDNQISGEFVCVDNVWKKITLTNVIDGEIEATSIGVNNSAFSECNEYNNNKLFNSGTDLCFNISTNRDPDKAIYELIKCNAENSGEVWADKKCSYISYQERDKHQMSWVWTPMDCKEFDKLSDYPEFDFNDNKVYSKYKDTICINNENFTADPFGVLINEYYQDGKTTFNNNVILYGGGINLNRGKYDKKIFTCNGDNLGEYLKYKDKTKDTWNYYTCIIKDDEYIWNSADDTTSHYDYSMAGVMINFAFREFRDTSNTRQDIVDNKDINETYFNEFIDNNYDKYKNKWDYLYFCAGDGNGIWKSTYQCTSLKPTYVCNLDNVGEIINYFTYENTNYTTATNFTEKKTNSYKCMLEGSNYLWKKI